MALTDEESDAMEMRFPVYVHGMDKMTPFCGVIRPEDDHSRFTITVPAERRPDASRLEIRCSPKPWQARWWTPFLFIFENSLVLLEWRNHLICGNKFSQLN